jgi:hypothetical protein
MINRSIDDAVEVAVDGARRCAAATATASHRRGQPDAGPMTGRDHDHCA